MDLLEFLLPYNLVGLIEGNILLAFTVAIHISLIATPARRF
jgi:hypothetical protein